MNNYDKEFLNTFNECYPFERYIIKEPKSIGNLFDDAVLTEIFVPHTVMTTVGLYPSQKSIKMRYMLNCVLLLVK